MREIFNNMTCLGWVLFGSSMVFFVVLACMAGHKIRSKFMSEKDRDGFFESRGRE